jgi:hypothetical protein
MTLNRMTVLIAAAGMIVSTAPVSAGALSIAGPIALSPHSQVEQIRYVRHRNGSAFPAALVGGIIAGVVGGAIGNGCYFNDCGYDDTGGYYGGSYYSGGYSGGYVHRGYGGAHGIGRGGAHGVGHGGGIHKPK